MVSPRASTSAPSEATKLVRALINFGGGATPDEAEEEQQSDLDNEDEEITVSGARAASTASKSKGKQKEVQSNIPAAALADLSLQSTPKQAAKQKPARSIRSLLRTSEHKITLPSATSDGEPTTRTLTSWKMADYAYKREPCPYPTRARGLFTERIEGSKGADEYRIIARGYDKFFNVNEVSWTQVSPRFFSASAETHSLP